MSTNAKTDYPTYLLLLSVAFLWGGSFAVSKLGLQDLSPLNLAGLRFILATLVFALVLWGRAPRLLPRREDALSLIIAGFMSITSYFCIQYTGLLYTTSINAALLLATSPLWTTIFSVMLKQEKITAKAFGGIALAFVGITLVISRGEVFSLFASETLYGDFLLLINALVWAGFNLYGKRIMQTYSPLAAMTYIHICGTVLLLPLIFIANPLNPVPVTQEWDNITLSTTGSLLYLGLLCSVYGFAMWYRGIDRIGVVRTASFYYLSPLFALFFGRWLLGESFSFLVVSGGLMVLAGVYVTNKYKQIL